MLGKPGGRFSLEIPGNLLRLLEEAESNEALRFWPPETEMQLIKIQTELVQDGLRWLEVKSLMPS